MGKDKYKKRPLRQRRYFFHNNEFPTNTRIHLVYYYSHNDQDVVLSSDGPFFDEVAAIDKMKEHLLRGQCAWVVAYNE